MSTPRAPRDLGTRGRKLYREVTALYELDPHDRAVLIEAARTVDELDVMRAALARDGATTKGSTGQIVEHPCLAGMRAHRATLDKLLGRLGLPAADGEAPPTPYQARSVKANTARWGAHRAGKAREAEVDRWARGSA